ncbi:hypothetical protein ACTXT7_004133 [Hymenolepis weldensis]
MINLILFSFLIDSTLTKEFCTPGFFGSYCSLRCHCLENNCNSTTNSLGCISGSCSPGYIGFPACQIVRAKLINPPQLEVECSKISVSWHPFNFSVDVGNADVREYRVELFSGNVTENKTVSTDQVMVDIHREVFTNLKPGETYWAQITPIFFVEAGGGDGYLEDGVPSPPSETVYVPKEDWLSNTVPFVTSDNSIIQTIAATNYSNILAFNKTVSSGGRLNSPRDCSLVGLSTNWAVFQWHHGSISCGLGDLVGYELSLAGLGQDTEPSPLSPEEVIIKRYRTDTFSTSIVIEVLRPGHRYAAQIFAIYEQGSVACSGIKMGGIESNIHILDGLGHFIFTTFTEIEAQSVPMVKINPLERSYDRFGLRVQISEAEIAEPVQLWTPTETSTFNHSAFYMCTTSVSADFAGKKVNHCPTSPCNSFTSRYLMAVRTEGVCAGHAQ